MLSLQMPSTMDSGTIVGYCAGEPWNLQTVFKEYNLLKLFKHPDFHVQAVMFT
jgi:hypothetical protein